MSNMTTKAYLPRNYALFIIAALFPQIFGFNGSFIDTLWKCGVVGALLLFSKINPTKISALGFCYIAISAINQIIAIFTENESIVNVGTNIVLLALLVIVFFEFPRQVPNLTIHNVMEFYKGYVYFMVVACLYNIAIHPSSLIHIASGNLYGTEYICSFFDNKNTFGAFLMFGCLAATILRYYTREKRYVVILTLFVINELMAMCRTAIVMSVMLLVFSFLLSKKGISLKRIFITGLIILVTILIIIFNNTINDFITGNLFSSTSSFDTRQSYITKMKDLITGFQAVCGYGPTQSKHLAYLYTGNSYYHNTYLNVTTTYGIVGLVLLLLSIFYALKTSWKVLKQDKAMGALCILSCAVYVIYAYVESTILFTSPVISMVATIFVISMPILMNTALIEKDKPLSEEVFGDKRKV